MKNISGFILGFFALSVFANAVTPVLPSLEWQKEELTIKIKEKLKEALAPMARNDQYVVNVSIKVRSAEKPVFANNSSSQAKSEEQPEKEVEKEKPVIRPTHKGADEIQKDYVIFSKLGLEAPLIGLDEPARAPAAIENNEAPEIKKEMPSYEQLWNYNEGLNIFKNLESININIKVSNEIPTQLRATLKSVIDSLDLTQGEVAPNLTIEYLDFKLPAKAPVKKGLDPFELISRFNHAIGLIIAAVILAIAGILMMKKQRPKERSESDGSSMTGDFTMSNEDGPNRDASAPATTGSEDNDKNYPGIDRLRFFLKDSPDEALLLLKNWIKSDGKEENLALMAIVQQFENNELTNLFHQIGLKEKELWKSKISRALVPGELNVANDFISKSIVEAMIVPSEISDTQVLESILEMTPAQAVQFIQTQNQLAPILLNVLPTGKLSEVLSLLGSEMAEEALSKSIKVQRQEITNAVPALKEALKRFKVQKTRTPFAEKIIQLIQQARPSVEESLYALLVKEQDFEAIEKVAKSQMPASLIWSLPEASLKVIINKLTLVQKVELICSLDEEKGQSLLSVFAPEKSVAREMFDIERLRMETNPEFQARIDLTKEDILHKFVVHARQLIDKDQQLKQISTKAVEEWILSLNEEKQTLKAVA